MNNCRQIESLLPPYVDGEAGAPERSQVEAHLATCATCRTLVAAQRSVRHVLRARAVELVTPAPPGLRTRLTATLVAPPVRRGWGFHVRAAGSAAILVLMLLTAFEFISPRSNVLYAAQLALDHVRCFVVELGTIDSAEPQQVQRYFADRYGWTVAVPPSNAEAGIVLVAARRCPFWLGEHAHLLYRSGDDDVSLYIDQGAQRPSEELRVLGHVEHIWKVGDASYVLVARGVADADLARISRYLQRVTRVQPGP